MTYLSVLDSEQWSLDRATLMTRLAEDWPGIEVSGAGSDGPSRSLGDVNWRYVSGLAVLDGYSHPDGTCLYLDGPIELAASFAVWHRRLVPGDIPLTFCDEGFNFDVLVTMGTKEDDLIAAGAG